MSPTSSTSKAIAWFKLLPAVQRVLISIAALVALAVLGVVGYTLATNQFIGLFLSFRDVAMLAYLFLVRAGAPLLLIIGIGTWLRRKLDPDAKQERHPGRERLPILQRIPRPPHLSARGILVLTFIATLWVGFLGITLARFFYGLGSTTNLSDEYPWGLWISFDVISGVALSAGGFVMAGTVHVFNVKRFHPIVRPAILTAFLGYLLVIVGILFDLGRWYNVWHAIFFWNWHSPMLEVAWCVMLYSTVLALEFSPVVLEKFNWQRPLRIVRAITLPVIIAGLVLSTLHQSTLGTLFLIFPEKMNPLWYSAFLPVFFFISAVAVGLGMVIVESNLSARFLGQQLESDLLASLGKAASVVLFIYAALKVYDLIARGVTAYLIVPGFHSLLYWVEMFFGVLVPMLVLATKRGRENPRTLLAAAVLIVGGVIMNRFDTSLLSWWSYTSGGPVYTPSLSEITVTLGLISIGVVAFGLIAKNFPVFTHAHHASAPAE